MWMVRDLSKVTPLVSGRTEMRVKALSASTQGSALGCEGKD